MVEKAKELAEISHGGQRYGNRPYFEHLEEVVSILKEFGYNKERTIAAAWLHDIVEDCGTDLGDLFPDDVLGIVDFCTDVHAANRKERVRLSLLKKLKLIEIAEEWVFDAIRVKAADRLANVRNSLKNNPRLLQMYAREHQEFCRVLYIYGICDGIFRELNSALKK